jgi:hypothetical protein
MWLHLYCSHNLADPDSAAIHLGDRGQSGPLILSLTDPHSPISFRSGLEISDVEALLNEMLYLEIRGDAEAIRGQISGNNGILNYVGDPGIAEKPIIRQDGNYLELYDDISQQSLFAFPIEQTNQFRLFLGGDLPDEATVDFAGGPLLMPDGVHLEFAPSPALDSLLVEGSIDWERFELGPLIDTLTAVRLQRESSVELPPSLVTARGVEHVQVDPQESGDTVSLQLPKSDEASLPELVISDGGPSGGDQGLILGTVEAELFEVTASSTWRLRPRGWNVRWPVAWAA